jgi:large subunit ribosomal protein L22
MQVKASIKNFRSTPRKARLIADFVRGKNVADAILELKFLNKKAADGFAKLISSAVANAENNKALDRNTLYIESVTVDGGKALKRHRAGSNGRALPFKRRLSHINLTLASREASKEDKK